MKAKTLALSAGALLLCSFLYSRWIEFNFNGPAANQFQRYYVARCETRLPQRALDCARLEVSLLSARGGLLYYPVLKLRIANDPSNAGEVRYLSVSGPPWVGQYSVRREAGAIDFYTAL